MEKEEPACVTGHATTLSWRPIWILTSNRYPPSDQITKRNKWGNNNRWFLLSNQSSTKEYDAGRHRKLAREREFMLSNVANSLWGRSLPKCCLTRCGTGRGWWRTASVTRRRRQTGPPFRSIPESHRCRAIHQLLRHLLFCFFSFIFSFDFVVVAQQITE